MRLLLTGGTGFIGRALHDALRQRGDEVVVISRARAAGLVGWDAMPSEVERADAIVHLAGEPIAVGRWTRARRETIRSSRVETTLRVARAIESAARPPRVFVSGSAIGIYGGRMDDEWLDEHAPAGDDELAQIVVAWEAAARPLATRETTATRVVHPRFGIALGSGGGTLESMSTPFKWFFGGSLEHRSVHS